MKTTLYLFTNRYPYSTPENFLEDEITYLCGKFDLVYVIPFMSTKDRCRDVPKNCLLLQPIIHDYLELLWKGLFSSKGFCLLTRDFIRNRVFMSWKRIKVWFTAYVATNSYYNSSVVKNIDKMLVGNEVMYFYWGKWSNVLSLYYKYNVHFVSRFHGDWDLWEERYGNYAPLRNGISRMLDAAVFISNKGSIYFHKKYPSCPRFVHRLGSKDIGICKRSEDGILRILSCSTVYPLKRVDLILRSVEIASEKQPIEWTHIGGGVDLNYIRELASRNRNPSLSIKLLGSMSYDDVMEFYKSHIIDIFINLSTNEGIPVSIMEAISCNVPVLATNVGGTSEIVCEETGMLVDKDSTPSEIASTILILRNSISRFNPRVFWEENYNGMINYSSFANFLLSLTVSNNENK